MSCRYDEEDNAFELCGVSVDGSPYIWRIPARFAAELADAVATRYPATAKGLGQHDRQKLEAVAQVLGMREIDRMIAEADQ